MESDVVRVVLKKKRCRSLIFYLLILILQSYLLLLFQLSYALPAHGCADPEHDTLLIHICVDRCARIRAPDLDDGFLVPLTHIWQPRDAHGKMGPGPCQVCHWNPFGLILKKEIQFELRVHETHPLFDETIVIIALVR